MRGIHILFMNKQETSFHPVFYKVPYKVPKQLQAKKVEKDAIRSYLIRRNLEMRHSRFEAWM